MPSPTGLLWSYEAELLIEAYNFHKNRKSSKPTWGLLDSLFERLVNHSLTFRPALSWWRKRREGHVPSKKLSVRLFFLLSAERMKSRTRSLRSLRTLRENIKMLLKSQKLKVNLRAFPFSKKYFSLCFFLLFTCFSFFDAKENVYLCSPKSSVINLK